MGKIYITGNVLRVYNLFKQNREISMSTKDVCEITKFTHSSVRAVLLKLYKKGLLNRTSTGMYYIYSFNGNSNAKVIDGHPWEPANYYLFRRELPETNDEIGKHHG